MKTFEENNSDILGQMIDYSHDSDNNNGLFELTQNSSYTAEQKMQDIKNFIDTLIP